MAGGTRLPISRSLVKGVTEADYGMTVAQFEAAAAAFFEGVPHPTLNRPYTHAGYRPMVELLDLLRANGFHVFICTGGGRRLREADRRTDVRRRSA